MSALGLLASFWIASLVAALWLDRAAVLWVKTAIVVAIPGLVSSIALAGATGKRLARSSVHGRLGAKSRRLRLIAANGGLVLLPCAIALWWLAGHAQGWWLFEALQGLELLAGGVNATLIVANVRDGMALERRPAAQVRAELQAEPGTPTASRAQ